MLCPKCGANIPDTSDYCIRCGEKLRVSSDNLEQKVVATYKTGARSNYNTPSILSDSDIEKRKRNFVGPILTILVLAGVGFAIYKFFPYQKVIDDITNFFDSASEGVARDTAVKVLENARAYYTNELYSTLGQSQEGKVYDISVLNDYTIGTKATSGSFNIIDDTEYGIELQNLVIKQYVCNGTKKTLHCEKIETEE